jgi:aspartate/methionine/tyrosine aminotransferase
LAPNVIVSNSLTKAYGLDGLRAGWMLGPKPQVRRAGKIYDLMGVNGVAPGELMALAAFRNLAAIRRRSQAILRPNLQTVRRFLAGEERLAAVLPPGGNVLFPRLPGGLTGDRLARHLRERHSTLIVPGSFFESPQHIRLGFGTSTALLNQGLANLRQALNELVGAGGRRRRPPA